MSSNYKSYFLRQLGIKESQLTPSEVNDPYKDIDPDELEMGTEDEKDEHGFPLKQAEKTAIDHLTAKDQGHYYSGMEKAKDQGMLKEKGSLEALMMLSPTAKAFNVLGSVKGSPFGGMPTHNTEPPTALPSSDTAIAPEGSGVNPKSKAALGGLELVSKQTPNSTLVDATPQNDMINSDKPISDIVPPTPAEEHPDQVQQVDDEPAQSLTGTSASGDAPMGDKPEPEKFEVDGEEGEENDEIDIDVPNEEGEENDEEGNEKVDPHMKNETINEGKHKSGCTCGFCKNKGSFGKKSSEEKEKSEETELDETFNRHKKLMREKLGIEEEKTDECKTCGCDKPNTVHPKKTKALTTEKLQALREYFFVESHKRVLTEQEKEVSKRIISVLKSRRNK